MVPNQWPPCARYVTILVLAYIDFYSTLTLLKLQCLANTQTQLDQARDEIKRLQLENASLKAKADAKQSNKHVTVTGPFDYTAELRLMANKFTLFDYPWVKYIVFQVACPPQAIPVEERYLSDENAMAHLRFRLFEAATTELKPYLTSAKISEFGNNVRLFPRHLLSMDLST